MKTIRGEIKNQCCKAATVDKKVRDTISRPVAFACRCVNLVKWPAPGTAFALLPKCPICLAAYVAAATGLRLSLTSARYMQLSLVVLCAGVFLYMILRNVFGTSTSTPSDTVMRALANETACQWSLGKLESYGVINCDQSHRMLALVLKTPLAGASAASVAPWKINNQ
jgi:hypothetical protein